MKRDRIVNPRADALVFQEGHQSFAVVRPHDVQGIDSTRPRGLIGSIDGLTRSLELPLVFRCPFTALVVPLSEMLKLYMKNSRLNGIQPTVVAFHVVVVLLRLAVVPDHADLRSQRTVVGGHRTSFATRSEILPRIKTE